MLGTSIQTNENQMYVARAWTSVVFLGFGVVVVVVVFVFVFLRFSDGSTELPGLRMTH